MASIFRQALEVIRTRSTNTTELGNALEILRTRYGYRAKTIAGPQYCCFEGKTLSEMRQELDTEG
jgi:hypothetical protein